MTITTNTTLIRIFLNQDIDIKKLKKKRYLIKVMLDNGMVIQLNDVPTEINDEFIDFKLNNSNQMIAKQLVDAANAVLIKAPSSVAIKAEEGKETNQPEETTMKNMNNIDIINKTKEIITSNDGLLKYYTSGTLDLDAAVSALTLPLNIALKSLNDNNAKEELINRFFNELKNPSRETIDNVENVVKAMGDFEEKLAKVPETMEINHQGTEQLKYSCNKIAKEAEEIISVKQSKDEKSSLDNKEPGELTEENKPFSNKVEESTLYSVAKTAGKVVGVAALGVVGYLSYNFIKSKLTS